MGRLPEVAGAALPEASRPRQHPAGALHGGACRVPDAFIAHARHARRGHPGPGPRALLFLVRLPGIFRRALPRKARRVTPPGTRIGRAPSHRPSQNAGGPARRGGTRPFRADALPAPTAIRGHGLAHRHPPGGAGTRRTTRDGNPWAWPRAPSPCRDSRHTQLRANHPVGPAQSGSGPWAKNDPSRVATAKPSLSKCKVAPPAPLYHRHH